MILKQLSGLTYYLEQQDFNVYHSLDVTNDVNKIFPNAYIAFTGANKINTEYTSIVTLVLSERLMPDDSNNIFIQDQLVKQFYTMCDKINKDQGIINMIIPDQGEFVKFTDDEHVIRFQISVSLKSYYIPTIC